MHQMKGTPFDLNDIQQFNQRMVHEVDTLFRSSESFNNNFEKTNGVQNHSYDQSLEHLSISIKNRLKVEEEEKCAIRDKGTQRNTFTDQLSNFENLVAETQK